MALQQIIKTIALKEWRTGIRDKSTLLTAVLLTVLLAAAVLNGARHYERESLARKTAEQHFRQQWLHQDPKHPHIAAHFGNFAVMPLTALSLFDPGLDAFSGKVIYLEPHKQNDFSFKPAEEQGSAARLGELSVALILQLLFPLIIIFTGYDAFTKERSSGNLRLLYSQGISFITLFLGKLAGRMVVVFVLFIPCILLLGVTLLHVGGAGQVLPRIAIMLLLYLLYLGLFTTLTLLVSALASSGRAAILSLITIWTVMTILLPRWAANVGDTLYPLPTKYEFSAAIHADIDKGIDGHHPSSTRAAAIQKQLLEKYHVDSISQLPFNFQGYIMEAGEEYSSQVYDKHFAKLQETLSKQNQLSLSMSMIDPFLAMHNLSMALSGTDYYTHMNFQQQAEAYRRHFVQQMNEDMKDHSALGDWEYKSSTRVFAKVPPFRYTPPTLYFSISPYTIGLISFAVWLLILCSLVYLLNQKNNRQIHA